MYLSRLLKILSGIILLFTCISFGQISEVHAGNLNSEESRLLEYVNRTFEQDGLSYKVNSSYKTKLRNKLMQDDIDLTAGDVEMIIGEINNNVATGVENGYLVLINEPTKAPTTEIPTTGESAQETVKPSEGMNQETETNGTETETNGYETETNQETETTEREIETINQGNSLTVPNENNLLNDSNGDNTEKEQNSEKEQTSGEKQASEEKKTSENEVTTPLKNTGYSIQSIPYLAAGLLILMLFGILSMYVINYIEVSNETKK